LRDLAVALEQIGCSRQAGFLPGPQILGLFLGVVLIAKASRRRQHPPCGTTRKERP
jgi:hypothetical protein